MMGTTSYYHFDGLGSTACLTDAAGSVTDRYEYTAYGEQLSVTGSTPNPFRYVGQSGYYRDDATGDYYVRARNYQPRMARWGSEEPLGYVDGLNLYQYVDGNPANLVDAFGLQPGFPPRADKEYQICRDKAFATNQLDIGLQSGYSLLCVLTCIRFFGASPYLLPLCMSYCIADLVYGMYKINLTLKADLKKCADDLKKRLDKNRPGPPPVAVSDPSVTYCGKTWRT